MSVKIGTEKVERKKGYLYFLGKDGLVWETPMKINKSKPGFKKAVVTKTPITRKPLCLYFLGKDGYCHEAKMNRAGRPKAKKA